MADDKAKEIIELRNRELAKQYNFRTLWQDISDMGTPFIRPIQKTISPGEILMTHIFDITMMEESENMASGLSNHIWPPGQEVFAIIADDKRFNKMQHIRRWFAKASETLHSRMANSNFVTQTDMSLLMWIQFGIANQYAEWTVKHGLNYRDYGIGMWQVMEDDAGRIDTMIMTVPKTARQCLQQFKTNLGKAINEALGKPETRNDIFNIIHVVRPRKERDERMIDALNNPFESFYVSEADEHTIEEGGFPEFPFAVPRYGIIHGEVYGRGRGGVALRAERSLNRAVKNFDEIGDKLARPPLEVLESFDGDVDVTPDAQNIVQELNSIRAIDRGSMGSYPVTKDWIEYRTQIIQKIYFKNVFEQLSMLTGDRRNELEIRARLSEGLKKLTKPIGRLFTEFYDVQISNSMKLLIRNGVLEEPPPELSGQRFNILYKGPLALALQDQQSQGLQAWAVGLSEMEQTWPGVKDNLDYDKASRDLAESLGVKTDHIRPIRQRDKIRADRAQLQQAQLQAEMLEQASKGYKNTKDAADEGSPAKQIQEAVSA